VAQVYREPGTSPASRATAQALRRAATWVASLNLLYFGVEFAVAMRIGSVSLFADSVDFLEDASVNGLILLALRWSAVHRARIGMLLAVLLLVPGAATAWTAWQKFMVPYAPSPLPLTLAGSGALIINLWCALMLARLSRSGGSLARAAFLSARNDVLGNLAIIAAGIVTATTNSAWPDLIAGLGIFVLNLNAAREVFSAARREIQSGADAES
jgi:Co/Zn/Cd efflux system component